MSGWPPAPVAGDGLSGKGVPLGAVAEHLAAVGAEEDEASSDAEWASTDLADVDLCEFGIAVGADRRDIVPLDSGERCGFRCSGHGNLLVRVD